jgi:hypothetical protein
MLVPIWTIPEELGSSVEVISSARAHLRQRRIETWTTGREVESMLSRMDVPEPEEERSESDAEYDEDEDELR